jgi:hemoglobin-like flavoprotein
VTLHFFHFFYYFILFYFTRLADFDSSGHFDAVLSKHTAGKNKIAARGALIIRIVDFVLKINEESKENENILIQLGKSHNRKAIRPWQYAIFLQTLLITIASRLGTGATNNVMEAWVNLFAYVVSIMLPRAIKGHVMDTEMIINTTKEIDIHRRSTIKSIGSASKKSAEDAAKSAKDAAKSAQDAAKAIKPAP